MCVENNYYSLLNVLIHLLSSCAQSKLSSVFLIFSFYQHKQTFDRTMYKWAASFWVNITCGLVDTPSPTAIAETQKIDKYNDQYVLNEPNHLSTDLCVQSFTMISLGKHTTNSSRNQTSGMTGNDKYDLIITTNHIMHQPEISQTMGILGKTDVKIECMHMEQISFEREIDEDIEIASDISLHSIESSIDDICYDLSDEL